MKLQLIKEKIDQAAGILKEKEIDLWLIFVRETSVTPDPVMNVVVGTNATWQSAFLINKNGDTTAIVGSLEVPHMTLVGTYKNVVGYLKSVREPLLDYLIKHNPGKIAINYSSDSPQADGLTHGLYLTLLDIVKETEFKARLVSSEEIIAALRGRKSETEISIMKQAVKETLKIYDEVTAFMKPGQTEKQVAAFISGKIKERGFEPAWDEEHCPAVYSGPETAGAHSGPTDRIIEKGHIVNMDFGVKINGYCSDLQRTWYILRDGETSAPSDVQKGFDVLKEAIRLAKEKVKPGIKGWEVDNEARSYIVANGYAEYQHALGHQVGKAAHDGGVGFYPQWERYGKTPFQPIEIGQIFTIEPRLYVEGKGVVTIEDEIIVTPDGAEYISFPQTELLLIK